MINKKLCALVIMDGFGIPTDISRSAITKDNTKNLQALAKKYPVSSLEASEGAVGLPDGQMGTSEVGHMTMGLGRVKDQSMVEIFKSIKSGKFFENAALLSAFRYAKNSNSAVHLIGIPTDGGIHSHIEHLKALLEMASKNNVNKVYVHFLGDGRDTPPKSALTYLNELEESFKEFGVGEVATVIGRFYALDRDNNWDRVQKAYDAIVNGVGEKVFSAKNAIESAYNRGETDEFISPSVIVNGEGEPVGTIKNGDVVISYNYRTDRAKQLVKVFDPACSLEWVNKDIKVNLVTMTKYDDNYDFASVAFPPKKAENILGEVLEQRGLKQVRIAETEKYAHVTFFFNDGKVEPFGGEDRELISSEKMKSYASNPKMSAKKVADKTIDRINQGEYNVVIVNFANPDMVGHSGDMEATKEAIAEVDTQVKRVVDAVLEKNGTVILTADHGNADCMILPSGEPCTSHTTALVPVFLIGKGYENAKLKEGGSLADIAPTILDVLGESKPTQMLGESLIIKG